MMIFLRNRGAGVSVSMEIMDGDEALSVKLEMQKPGSIGHDLIITGDGHCGHVEASISLSDASLELLRAALK